MGIYPDPFNAFWFTDIGIMLATSMLLEMIWPFIEYPFDFLLRYLSHAIDQRHPCPRDKTRTNCKSILEFDKKYSGPDIDTNTQHAYILNLVYLVCLFGPGQPFLFLVAFVNILLRYFIERILLAYYYRRPVVYDSKLN